MAGLNFVDIHCSFGASVATPMWNQPEQIRSTLAQRGIGKAFLASRLARRFDPVEGNEEILDIVTDDGTVDLRGWLVVHPSRTEDLLPQMRKHLISDRFAGAALYEDPVTGDPVTVREAAEIVRVFQRYGKPLLINTPSAKAMHEALRIAQEFPAVKIIASGMGGDEWREAVPLAAKPTNLSVDISGALTAAKIDYALSIYGNVRKLFFASNSPRTDPGAVMAMLFEAKLTDEERAKILFGNAERLFGLGVAGEDDGDVPALMPMARL